ncbi:MAG: amino acid ABC transporter permease [Sporolactobacillus sp.]
MSSDTFIYMLQCVGPIMEKFPVTLYMTVMSTLLALLFGMVSAAIIKRHCPILAKLFQLINSFLKGVPVLVILFIFYYSLPPLLATVATGMGMHYNVQQTHALTFGIIAFGITYIPYMSDMLITSYDAVPKGQLEAGYAIGMSTMQAMRRIIIPQMIVISLPVFGNHLVNILKATALAYMINILEMMGAAENYAAGTQRYMETYIVVALIYWAICIAFDKAFVFIESLVGNQRNKAHQERTRVTITHDIAETK